MVNGFRLVFLALLVWGCGGLEEEQISLEEIINLEVLDLEGNLIDQSLLSDGETLIKLRASIPKNSEFKNLDFVVSAGSFEETGIKTQQTVANIDGVAEVNLKLPFDEESILVKVSISNGRETFSSSANIDLQEIGEAITLEVLDSNNEVVEAEVLADGSTIIRLVATVPYNLSEFNTVGFETSAGTFAGISDVSVNDESKAIIDLKVPTEVQRIYLKARINNDPNYFDDKDIDLKRSNPDFIIIEPSVINMALQETNTIDIYLRKEIGKVSKGSSANIRSYQIADDNTQLEIGRFTGLAGALTDDEGKITVNFHTDTMDIAIDRPVYIEVSSMNDLEQAISEQIQININ